MALAAAEDMDAVESRVGRAWPELFAPPIILADYVDEPLEEGKPGGTRRVTLIFQPDPTSGPA